jgi:uncharacterized protein (DUF924 family)
MSTFTAPPPTDILDFWFGAAGSPERGQFRAEWFKKDAVFDETIRMRFGAVVEAALAGGLEEWEKGPAASPASALALILVLDQFPRNLYRGDARAFAGDARARDVAAAVIDRGWGQQLADLERIFAYMPFEHSEAVADQERSLALFGKLAEGRPAFASTLDYAQRHYDIIARFGRFPHRNAALGRPSTTAELEFLAQPGSGF